MSNKFTFFILSGAGTPVKQTTITRRFLYIICSFLFSMIIVTAYTGYDYYSLKFTSENPDKLQKIIASQEKEIAEKNDQIQNYAKKINGLKTKLLTLNDFEQKLRVIANIQQNSDFQDSIFGVGGGIPEDLDTDFSLDESHNSLIREIHQQIKQIDQAADKQEEGFSNLYQALKEQRNLLASTPAIRPTKGYISSRFGYRISPFTGKRSLHKGLDIANNSGTKIIATADGVITYSGPNGNMGIMIAIDHGHGVVTRYGHLSKVLKKAGVSVKRGDAVGLMGSTGRSTGPHVHYEVKLNGIAVNPAKYILD